MKTLAVTVTFDGSLLPRDTVTPPAGAADESESVAGETCPGASVAGVPKMRVPGADAAFVKLNVAEPAAMLAVTWYEPACPFAVSVCERATPWASVTAVLILPAKVALGPLFGAANVTVMPLTGLLLASRTVADNGSPNGEFKAAV